MRLRQLTLVVSLVALVFIGGRPGMSVEKEGHLVIHAYPKQAYVYADGEPIVESLGHFIRLSPGEHTIELLNYGYKPVTRQVNITSHKTMHLDVTMQAIPGILSGPWGCITVEGAPRAAVLLNGTEPAVFFVGHGDEFNNEFGPWKQELIVPPGHHQLTVEYLKRQPWTTTVDVQANQRVVVDAYKGVKKTVSWSRGERLKEEPYFRGGIASTKVVVQPVAGQFRASTGQINCGDSAQLIWSANGAGKVEINGQTVADSGNETVQPKQATDYKFTAMGPGGVYNSDARVDVNNTIPASLTVSPATNEQNTATVTWSAPNADSVTIDPLGTVGPNGSREVAVTPTQSEAGPVDQDITYTLHASNVCGGSETRTATLHLTGKNPVVQQEAANTPPPPPPAMPRTASEIPLLGLLGVLGLAAAALLRIILKVSA